MKRAILSAAVATAIGLGMSGQAAAYTYAGSTLEVDSLSILITENGTDPSPNAPIRTFTITTTNTALLNFAGGALGAGCSGSGPDVTTNNNCGQPGGLSDPGSNGGQVNAIQQAVGDVAAAEDVYTLRTPGVGSLTYSRADSQVETAQLAGDASSNSKQIAESEVQSAPSVANANAEIKSSTGFTFTFDVTAANQQLILSFDATPELLVDSDNPGANPTATAGVAVSFLLSEDGTNNSISWAPDGADGLIADACAEGTATTLVCSAETDPESLNTSVGITTNTSDSYTPGLQSYSLTIDNLGPGSYTFELTQLVTTFVEKQPVPAPGVLALMGLGLFGIAAVRRRS